jgi:hypothetical protein
MYPFAEVASAESREHEILTVCTARPAGGAHGKLKITQTAAGWRVTGKHGDVKVHVRLTPGAGNAAPAVQL